MKLSNNESSLWQRRLKYHRNASVTTSIPSHTVCSDTSHHHQRRKPATSKMRASLSFLFLCAVLFVVPTGWYIYFQDTSVHESPVELFCKNTSEWSRDVLWRTSVQRPRLCPPKPGVKSDNAWEITSIASEQLQQTIDYRTPCGAYCAFHTDSLAYANPVVAGWVLNDRSGRGSNGCWEPIFKMHTHSCAQWFDTWIVWMKATNKTPSEVQLLTNKTPSVLPPPQQTCPECEAKRKAALAIAKRCQGHNSWKNDTFWRNSVEDPEVCFIGVPKPDASLNLGIDHLVDSLANWTPCGSYCVFHEESRPIHDNKGRNIKGWSLRTQESDKEKKGCFYPITDIQSSHCNQWYESWANWVNTTTVGRT